MKLVKIFGMVLALHIVLLTVFFLSPGCQSTPKTTTAPAQEEAPAPVPVSENWSSQPAPSTFASAAPLTGLTPAERARQSPMRPDNPGAFIATGDRPAALEPEAPPPPPAPTTYTVVSGDSLWKIARKFGTTVPELTRANPGLKADAIRPGDVIRLPAGLSAPATEPGLAPAQPVPSGAASATYVVKAGDSLSRIAARNGTTVAALRSANNLATDTVQIGQTLVIPAAAPAASGPAPAGAPQGVSIVVQSGETLGEIARRFDVTVQQLMSANGIADPRRIRAGQTLVIPGFEPVAGAPAVQAPRPAPARQVEPPPPAAQAEPVVEAPPPVDLDSLLPADAPVVPIDEPVPQP